MRRSFIFAIGLLFSGLICLSQSNGYWQSRSQVVITVSAPVYTYRGSGTDNSGNNDATFSIDLGTASSDRLVIVGTTVSAATSVTSIVANSVSLTPDVSAVNAYRVAIYSALVTSGSGSQNVVVTFASASFQEKNVFVWTATGLASNVVKQTANGLISTTINASAGDFLFGVSRAVALFPDFATSTETPDGTRQVGTHNTSADWTVDATNASFSVNAGAASNQMVAASYR